MKKKIRVFISYAHRNKEGAKGFIDKFVEYCSCSKTFDYSFWYDGELLPGMKWDEEIQRQLDRSDCGLLLISPSFLNSSYIRQKELPALLKTEKIIIPVGLSKIHLEKHDLWGLENYQIYRYLGDGFKEPRCYLELKAKRRMDFIDDLFTSMENRLKAY